jgi:hypothetical protein
MMRLALASGMSRGEVAHRARGISAYYLSERTSRK